MERPETWWQYYGTLVLRAHRVSREQWESLVFLAGELFALLVLVLPRFRGWVGDQADWYYTRHPLAPWVLGVGMLLVALGRANWRGVKAKDAEITKWRRDTSDTYKQLVATCRAIDAHLLAGQPAALTDQTAVEKWVEIAKGLRGAGMLTATLTLLTEGEKLKFSLLEVNGIPNNWGHSQDHRLHYFTLKHIRRLLLKAVMTREPPMGWDA